MSSTQEQLLHTVLAGAPGLLALKNSALTYEVVNPAFCQFLGKGPEEIIGKTDRHLFPEAEAFSAEEEEAAVLASGAPRQKDFPLTGQNGSILLRIVRSAVLDGSGDPVGVFFYATDISEIQARAEAAVEDRIRLAEAKADAAQRHIHVLEDELHEKQHRASDAERRAKVAESDLEGARRALSILRAAPMTVEEDLSQRAAELETQCRALSSELEKSKAAAERAYLLDTEVAALRKRLQEESDSMTRQAAKMKEVEMRAEEARQRVEGVELEAVTAREKRTAAEALAAEQAQRIAALEESIAVLRSEKDLMEEDAEIREELEARIAELQARLEEAEKAASEAKGGGEDLQKLIEEAKVKDTTIAAYEKTFRGMRDDMSAREREIAELRDALEEAKTARDAQETAHAAPAVVAEADGRVADLEDELKKKIEAMTAFGIEAGKREEELKDQLDQFQERVEKLEDEAVSLRERQNRAAELVKQLLETLGIE